MAGQRGSAAPSGWLAEAGRNLGRPRAWFGAERLRRASWPKSEPPCFRHRLLAGYAAGGVCYAVGRVLTVRGHRLSGAWVHTGVHIFANMGNLFLLRYLR